jgi:hypothetical protein
MADAKGDYEAFTEQLLALMEDMSAQNYPAAVAAVGAFTSEVVYQLSLVQPEYSRQLIDGLTMTLHEIRAGLVIPVPGEPVTTH